jgi:hypothetical protein
MNTRQYIFVAGPTEDKIKEATQELANLYADSGYAAEITIFQSTASNDQYVITFPADPDLEHFMYFVNFLAYPTVQNYTGKPMGFCTAGTNDITPASLTGKRLLLYVSDHDNEGDNVFAIYEGAPATMKLGFSIGERYKVLKTKEFDFAEPQINPEDYTVHAIIRPDPDSTKNKRGCTMFAVLVAGIAALISACFSL